MTHRSSSRYASSRTHPRATQARAQAVAIEARKRGRDRFFVLGSAFMIVIYLAFSHAFAANDPAQIEASSLRLMLPKATGPAPSGAPQVLQADYGVQP